LSFIFCNTWTKETLRRSSKRPPISAAGQEVCEERSTNCTTFDQRYSHGIFIFTTFDGICSNYSECVCADSLYMFT